MHFASLLQGAAQLTGSAFVAGLWQGTLLASALWLCLRFAKEATAALRFTLWAVVLLLVCLLPVLEMASPRAVPHSFLKVDLRWSLALAVLWLAVSLFRAASLAWHGYTLWTLHRQAVPVAQPPFLQSLLANTHRQVQLCTSHHVDRPGVIGFFAPRILIPAWLHPQLTAPELEQIVLHEVEHLRRGDDWLNLLQKLALVFFPLNPVLVAVERLLCMERELACDDGVLRRTRAPRLYATCLATLAERSLDHRAFSLGLGTLGDPERPSKPSRSELARRIQRILRHRTASSSRYAHALTAVVGVGLLCGAAGLARCPQLVAFVPATPVVATLVPTTPPPAHTMHVVYADAQTVAPRLVRTSFPLVRQPHTAPVHHRKPLPTPQAHLQKPIAPRASLLLTAWPEQERPRFLNLGTDLPETGHFAVFRVDGGWLLLQL